MRNSRSIYLVLGVALVIGAGLALLVNAAPPVCGDGVVQAPNSEGKNEKCDDGSIIGGVPTPAETNKCTAQCGQKLLGWAWNGVTNGGGDLSGVGWISLNSDTCQFLDPNLPPDICGPQGVTYYVQVTADDTVIGWGWADTAGWVCFGTKCQENSDPQYSECQGEPPAGDLAITLVNDSPDTPSMTGWAKICSQEGNGWVSMNCSNDDGCASSDYNVRLVQATFGSEQRRTLSGWGWNGNDDNSGFGWIQFNPPVNEIPAWLQTKYGDIYAHGGLTGQQAPGYNATYRILSNGSITQFTSAQGQSWVSPMFGRIDFPTPETRYSNILGSLDVDGLICQFGAGKTCVNKYGTSVEKMTGALPNQLAGKIYYYPTGVTIGSPGPATKFNNTTNFESAAGTVVVDGDLIIEGNMEYGQSTALTKFKNLASIAWIVKGDVRIAPSVTNLVGSFIVIGNGTACSPDEDKAHCGEVYSCDGTGCQNSLTVSGLMMARKFKLERTYKNQLEGSEVIIYDGRLLANTPPGLVDFAKALPIWRSGTFAP